MNKEEALTALQEHHELIGKEINGQEVTNLIILPANGERVGEIVGRIVGDKPYTDILLEYSDYTILVIFDIELFVLTGVLMSNPLNKVLNDLTN